MVCRFCGEELKTLAQTLRSKYSDKCKSSASGKHVAVSDGQVCVYCGEKVKTMCGVLRSKYSDKCPASPTKKHTLQ